MKNIKEKEIKDMSKDELLDEILHKETAKELFEKLGYKKQDKRLIEAWVNDKSKNVIVFNRVFRNVSAMNEYDTRAILNMKELQAINKRIEELEWIKY